MKLVGAVLVEVGPRVPLRTPLGDPVVEWIVARDGARLVLLSESAAEALFGRSALLLALSASVSRA